MHTKLMNIRDKLMNNVVTYRDERLPMEAGHQMVTPMAMELRRSKFWRYASIAIFLGWLLFQIVIRAL